MDGEIHLTVANHVAEILLDRPAKHNALTPEMYEGVTRAAAEVNARDDVNVVIIHGAGERAFCAGSDIKALDGYEDFWAWRNRSTDYIHAIRAIRKPVISAVKGWALGGGLEIALASDLRVVSETAVFSAPEVTLGWTGAGGAAQHLTRGAGYGKALKYLLTGDRFDAKTADDMGLVEWLVPAGEELDKAREVASRIAGFAPVATQSVKAAVRAAMNMPVDLGLQAENELMSLCFAKNEAQKRAKDQTG